MDENPSRSLIRARADLDRAWATHRDHLGLLESIAKRGRISSADHEQKFAITAIQLVVAELRFMFAEDLGRPHDGTDD